MAEYPIIDVYRGLTALERRAWHTRTVDDYNRSWKKEIRQIPSFDEMLAQQITLAANQKRDRVVVIDAGGGEGYFARDFLSNMAVSGKSRDLLERHPEIHVEIVTFTDAQSSEEFGHSEPLPPFEDAEALDNSRIYATRIPYSVTSTQSIDKFMDLLRQQMEINAVDLVVSVGFLTYLTPGVFGNVVSDFCEHLAPGGEMVLVDYATMAGFRLSRDDVATPVDLRDQHTGELLGNTARLRQEGEVLLANDNVTDDEIGKMVVRLTWLIVRSGAFDQDKFFHSLSEEDRRIPRRRLQWVLHTLLPEAEGFISFGDAYEIRNTKQEVLATLQQRRRGYVVQNTDNVIWIKRK